MYLFMPNSAFYMASCSCYKLTLMKPAASAALILVMDDDGEEALDLLTVHVQLHTQAKILCVGLSKEMFL